MNIAAAGAESPVASFSLIVGDLAPRTFFSSFQVQLSQKRETELSGGVGRGQWRLGIGVICVHKL
ncbi:unnamed protein product [Eruca vesicaria subsp. sativa]|uniref:Uncharacterized protein n=1 Tax=Eruca vesicaria subsp. sativa TaxID=29727 RepID=A0ABC8LXE4_ERUVS|nr:unnamed protein product [Eruca vesicaria subsp. sativa]